MKVRRCVKGPVVEVQGDEKEEQQIERETDQKPDINFSLVIVKEWQGHSRRRFGDEGEHGNNADRVGDVLSDL